MNARPSLGAAYATGERVTEVASRAIAAADESDAAIWIARVAPGTLLERARALDAVPHDRRAALPLFGLPFAVKDNIDVAGMPTTAACSAFAYEPERSPTALERLKRRVRCSSAKPISISSQRVSSARARRTEFRAIRSTRATFGAARVRARRRRSRGDS